jgi:hypothetical protein
MDMTASGGVVKPLKARGFKKRKSITPSSVNGDLNFTAIYRAKQTVCRNIERCNLLRARIFDLTQIKEID